MVFSASKSNVLGVSLVCQDSVTAVLGTAGS